MPDDYFLYCGDFANSLHWIKPAIRELHDQAIAAGHEAPRCHVITDPPYEDELHKAVGKIKRIDGQQMIETLGFDGINARRAEYAQLLVDLSDGWTIIFSIAEGIGFWRDELQKAGAKWDTTCAWIKPDASPRFNGQGPARGFECFMTMWCSNGHRSWNGGGKRGVYTHAVNPPGRDGRHPTEKPVSLMRDIIADFTQPGDIVVDPFMGSGSTGIAALQLGRKFIGCDISPQHFTTATERLQEQYKQPDLLIDLGHDPIHSKRTGKLFA